ncbi:hypothetical protein [Glaciimonas soli]|uniref:Lysozyme inhibitor LprI N-terminal domain-containing protein n=1 Tax=Glaciimonas soli TaxID=2590999 RepID=A0A843YTY8_9BURK|nr:hypothetical protein [Glaciimonas soli]MQR00968.1 hypothetical protein [Glaciimonas soli]
MQAIKFCAITLLIFFISNSYAATTNPECLNHLGGAFADVECYNGLSNDLIEENKILINKISSTIPAENPNKNLLKQYAHQQKESKKYCQLSRDSLNAWVTEKPASNPRYFYYDAAYYQCVYDNNKYSNGFLKEILKNTTQ